MSEATRSELRWQPWEMSNFGDGGAPRQPRLTPEQQQAAEELARALNEARRLGHEEGLRQGHAEGHQQGHAQGHAQGLSEARTELDQLRRLLASVQADRERMTEAVADDLLRLALETARAFLKTALPAKPELLLPLVRESLAELPFTSQPATLTVHPEDARLLQRHLSEELRDWRIREDDRIERGGCRLDTAQHHVDAGNAQRWHRLTAALSRDLDWLT